MNPDERAAVIARLQNRLPEYLKGLRDIASDVRSLRQDVHEREVMRELWSLMILTVNLLAEVTAFTHRLLLNPEQRVIWAKYLVLLMHEGLVALPRVIGRVDRAARNLGPGPSAFDVEAFRNAASAYKAAVKPIRQDARFMNWIEDTRNTAAAHHLTGRQAEIKGLMNWVLSAGQVEGPNKDDVLVRRALEYITATLELSYAAFRAFDYEKLPPLSKDPVSDNATADGL